MKERTKKVKHRHIPIITESNPRSLISEQYRLIRTNIQFSSIDKDIKSIMVTSPESGDGKSMIASNLSIVLAQQEKQVLIVDTDLRKPSLHEIFRINNDCGLTSVLAKRKTLDEVILNTYIPNLKILTSGQIPPNPSELLSSMSMAEIIEKLVEQFDFVIFDTPPALAVTDPQIIGNKCDGVIFVVSSGKTHKDAAIKAKELLIKAKSRILGVVINGVKEEKKNVLETIYK